MLLLHSMLIIFVLQAGAPAAAQSGKKPDDVVHVLKAEISAYLSKNVLPPMLIWKQQFDESLKAADLLRLEALRKQSRELREKMTALSNSFAKAKNERDFRRALDFRSKLEFAFDNRRRILGEAQRIGQRSRASLELLQARIDSSKEEWKGGAIRIFIDWFARHQAEISPALNDDRNTSIVGFMAAAKDLRLEKMEDDAVFRFLLWDGSDFVDEVIATMRPETPLTYSGPARDHTLLLEQCSPPTFSTSTLVRFSLPSPGRTRIQVVDQRGKVLAVLLDEHLQSGKHSCSFPAGSLPPGAYFVVLSSREFSDVQVAQISR